jgi:hypothetical protein
MPARRAMVVPVAAIALLGAGCGAGGEGAPKAQPNTDLPQGSEAVKLDPDDFTTRIDNPYWPMKPGSRWVYRETDDAGAAMRVEVTVTNKTKRIANGVEARVVHDEVTEGGKPIEVTDDWYAQDREGNVWYLGEATAEYENGKVKTRAGSFEAGVDGAQPGIAVPADPRPGVSYRQEYYRGEAEDKARVLSVDDQAEVPAGHFTGTLTTRDVNPLDPKVLEYKLYARGVGPVLVLSPSGGGGGKEQLVKFSRG